jgi:hypothetical protein
LSLSQPNPYSRYLESIGQTIVGDPTVKSIYTNGADIVSQVKDQAGNVTAHFGQVAHIKRSMSHTVGVKSTGENIVH